MSGCTLGRELLRLARSQLPQKPGCALRLSLCGVELWPDESLEAQGVQAETGTVISYAYSRVCLLKAWNALKGHARDAEQALEGTTKLCFHNPINSLLGVTLPSTLKSLTFGDEFDQRLQEITLPGSLQNLTFGHDFSHFGSSHFGSRTWLSELTSPALLGAVSASAGVPRAAMAPVLLLLFVACAVLLATHRALAGPHCAREAGQCATTFRAISLGLAGPILRAICRRALPAQRAGGSRVRLRRAQRREQRMWWRAARRRVFFEHVS